MEKSTMIKYYFNSEKITTFVLLQLTIEPTLKTSNVLNISSNVITDF